MNTNIIKGTWLMLVSLLSFLATGCSDSSYRTIDGAVWHTTYHISYKSDRHLDDSVIVVLKEVDDVLSAFNSSSLVTKLNRGFAVEKHPLFSEVMRCAGEVNRLSGGAFDPTIAPIVNLWGFGFNKNDFTEPSAEMIDSALRLVGLQGCIAVEGDTMRAAREGLQLDLSAIAKGYACDLIGRMLERNGCEDYLVEIGGEMALRGNGPRGDRWMIQIDTPQEDSTATHSRMLVINAGDCGVATSGNYRNYRDLPSYGRVGHTISPVDGHPFVTRSLSATIIAPSAMMADALATATMAMPTDSAIRMLEGIPDVSALIVTADTVSGRWQLQRVGGFPEGE